jgi:hypothetical protein
MSTSKKLIQLNLEIHKVSHQECFAVDGDLNMDKLVSPLRI